MSLIRFFFFGTGDWSQGLPTTILHLSHDPSHFAFSFSNRVFFQLCPQLVYNQDLPDCTSRVAEIKAWTTTQVHTHNFLWRFVKYKNNWLLPANLDVKGSAVVA
jgi:hypothetical protein